MMPASEIRAGECPVIWKAIRQAAQSVRPTTIMAVFNPIRSAASMLFPFIRSVLCLGTEGGAGLSEHRGCTAIRAVGYVPRGEAFQRRSGMRFASKAQELHRHGETWWWRKKHPQRKKRL